GHAQPALPARPAPALRLGRARGRLVVAADLLRARGALGVQPPGPALPLLRAGAALRAARDRPRPGRRPAFSGRRPVPGRAAVARAGDLHRRALAARGPGLL